MAAVQRTNPGLYAALVVLALSTIIFAVLVYNKQTQIDHLLNGDPDKPSAKSLPILMKEEADLRRQMAEDQEKIRVRERALGRADLEIARHRVYYDGDQVVASVATPGAETEVVRGVPTKVKDSSPKFVMELVNRSATRLEAYKTEWSSDDHQKFPPLEAAIRKRQDELGGVLRKIADQDAEFQKDRAALAEQQEKLAKEKELEEKKQREEYGQRNTRITQLEDEIRKLLGREMRWFSEIEPTGSVLAKEETTQRLVIDLGRRERVIPGLLFSVFTFDKGAYSEKGMIEVIEVQDTLAIARAISVNDAVRHPFAKGDYIGNPTFDVRKPRTFFVSGEFKRYNKEDLETFIRRSGGLVAEKLGPGVDFLIAGERSEPDQAAAREYQVLGMSEDTLLKFVQPAFEPRKR